MINLVAVIAIILDEWFTQTGNIQNAKIKIIVISCHKHHIRMMGFCQEKCYTKLFLSRSLLFCFFSSTKTKIKIYNAQNSHSTFSTRNHCQNCWWFGWSIILSQINETQWSCEDSKEWTFYFRIITLVLPNESLLIHLNIVNRNEKEIGVGILTCLHVVRRHLSWPQCHTAQWGKNIEKIVSNSHKEILLLFTGFSIFFSCVD